MIKPLQFEVETSQWERFRDAMRKLHQQGISRAKSHDMLAIAFKSYGQSVVDAGFWVHFK